MKAHVKSLKHKSQTEVIKSIIDSINEHFKEKPTNHKQIHKAVYSLLEANTENSDHHLKQDYVLIGQASIPIARRFNGELQLSDEHTKIVMEFSPCLDGVQLELLKEDRLKDDGLNFELEIKAVKSESDKPGPYVITYHWEAIPQQTPEFLIDFGDAPTINYKATHLLEATHLYSSPEKFLKSKITFKLLLLPSSSIA